MDHLRVFERSGHNLSLSISYLQPAAGAAGLSISTMRRGGDIAGLVK
jgi:hypothetical protein